MIGYTPAEQAIRTQRGEPYATGTDQDTPQTREPAQEEAMAA